MRARSIVPATNLRAGREVSTFPSWRRVETAARAGDALEFEPSGCGIACRARGSGMLDVAQQRGLHLSLLKARPVVSGCAACALSLEEEPLRLPEDLPGLLELERALLEVLERRVHRLHARLGLAEPRVEVIERLRAACSVRGDERGRLGRRADVDPLGGDLLRQEAEAAFGLRARAGAAVPSARSYRTKASGRGELASSHRRICET